LSKKTWKDLKWTEKIKNNVMVGQDDLKQFDPNPEYWLDPKEKSS
jgi:hypothetical protein